MFNLKSQVKNSLLKRGPDLLCNLKGDLLGGTRADTVSLFGGESEIDLGCCCLKTSVLGPVIENSNSKSNHSYTQSSDAL